MPLDGTVTPESNQDDDCRCNCYHQQDPPRCLAHSHSPDLHVRGTNSSGPDLLVYGARLPEQRQQGQGWIPAYAESTPQKHPSHCTNILGGIEEHLASGTKGCEGQKGSGEWYGQHHEDAHGPTALPESPPASPGRGRSPAGCAWRCAIPASGRAGPFCVPR